MEFRTRKNIIYRISNNSACTYDIDDTPPFPVNREALDIAMEIALMEKLKIVGELHIMRKQYLDGSIPTGFQRTAIIGIEGQLPLRNKIVRIRQLSIEEDSCREISDIGHERIYTTDRLGMPLIETVTEPELLTPQEAAECAQYIRFLGRSTDRVRMGPGAARQDVNVSVKGGTRVEIKGVSSIKLIPRLTHNEAFRQKSLLSIRDILREKIKDISDWQIHCARINVFDVDSSSGFIYEALKAGDEVWAVRMPDFAGLLSFFTQPGRMFAAEFSDRLKVIAGLEKPNMIHSESIDELVTESEADLICRHLKITENDAWIIFRSPAEDVKIALETIEERAKQAFEGVPNETRRPLENGTTLFERVLPGPDRMYPDTDSAPVAVKDSDLEKARARCLTEVAEQLHILREWGVPEESWNYLLRRNFLPFITDIVKECELCPKFIARLFAQKLKRVEGQIKPDGEFNWKKMRALFAFVRNKSLRLDILSDMLPYVFRHPSMLFDSVLEAMNFVRYSVEEIESLVPVLCSRFRKNKRCRREKAAMVKWVMGRLRKMALGNCDLANLNNFVKREVGYE
jgi:glutamyl-tRNA(Gln) amidotransferase subunit E